MKMKHTQAWMISSVLGLGLGLAVASAQDAPPAAPPPPPGAGDNAATLNPAGTGTATAGFRGGRMRDGIGGGRMAREAGAAGEGMGLERLKERFQQRNPEEFKKLMELRENDPEAFKARMRELTQEAMLKGGPGGMALNTPEDAESMKLAKQYQDASTPEEKAKLKEELRKTVANAFDKRLEAQKKRFAEMEEHVTKAKAEFADREKNRSDIIANRVDELTKDPKLRWGGGALDGEGPGVKPVPPAPPPAAPAAPAGEPPKTGN